MRRQFVTTTVLAAALLFSQGGNFLVAALCPHLRSGMASCETQTADPAMSHENMGHMGMDHEMSPAYPDPDTHSSSAAIDKQHRPCSHCAVHSRTSPRAASLRETEAAKHSYDLSIPVHGVRVAPAAITPVAVLTSRAHGPPGGATSKHILLNIFRI